MARKQRIVAPENRQRAAYSCDRCRIKKIKCVRSDHQDGDKLVYDKTTKCINCSKAGVDCRTKIPRRRRVYGSFENLGTHYQIVLKLLQGIYPHLNINDVDELIKIGESVGIDMDLNDDNNLKSIEVESQILRPFFTKNLENHSPVPTKGQVSSSNDPLVNNSTNQVTSNSYIAQDIGNSFSVSETLLLDSKGGSHYVGSSGTPVLFKLLCSLLLKRSYRTKLSFDSNIKLFQNYKLSNKFDYKSQYSSLINEPNFPILPKVLESKTESYLYVDHFFNYLHPFYFIFDETQFRINHEIYWKFVEDKNFEPKNSETLSTPFIGCLYLVWIISSKLTSTHTVTANSLNYQKLDNVFQLIFTEISLNSSITSIQFLFLFAVYLHASKNRDSSWNVIGLAIRQAISLGLHRKFKDDKKDDNLKSQLFWSLYQYELTLCSTFGRQSNLNDSIIDINLPVYDKINSNDKDFKKYFVSILTMSQFLNIIIKERKDSTNETSRQIISPINIERILSMKNQLCNLRNNLEIVEMEKIGNIYDYKLNLTFHYYMIILTLPFLLYITTANFKIKEDEILLSIVKTGLKSAINIAQLLNISLNKRFNYGALSTDCLYGYSSTLVLSLFFIYLSNSSNDLVELNLSSPINNNELDIDKSNESIIISKKTILEYSSDIIEFMSYSPLDGTNKRILEVIKGIANDLKLVEIQDDLSFDVLNFGDLEENDHFDAYDSLFMNNEIYLDVHMNNGNQYY
ncbi:hypothetical protein WICMUC_001970 [Wickerhamomyces mucosus]|uniref:Zn(2)-C6 fungal-type domain-containing protein n=1 Tax=Wickerhamomyces mucosus TaxID=1378264 RepID=A0A9P8PTC2_9ASCO|nr:hypothetical protein WICMUC_001970 [Wickerhamomyces mucosus]